MFSPIIAETLFTFFVITKYGSLSTLFSHEYHHSQDRFHWIHGNAELQDCAFTQQFNTSYCTLFKKHTQVHSQFWLNHQFHPQNHQFCALTLTVSHWILSPILEFISIERLRKILQTIIIDNIPLINLLIISKSIMFKFN